MKKLFFLVGFLVVIGAIAYLTVRTGGTRGPSVGGVFINNNLGVSFRYNNGDDGYVVRVATASYDQLQSESAYPYVGSVTLIRKADAAVAMPNTEGPQSLSVTTYLNPKNLTAEAWAQTGPFSMTGDAGVFTPVNIGGVRGVRYTGEGLYPLDTVILTKSGKTYIAVAMADASERQLASDFTILLNTLKLR